MPHFPTVIYETLLSAPPSPPSWRDSVFPVAPSPEDALLHQVDLGCRRMIQGYLSGCHPHTFFPGGAISSDAWLEPVDGFLQQGDVLSLVDIVVVSTSEYATLAVAMLPRMAALAAAKAHAAGADEAVLIFFDRNKSDWCAFEVEGDLVVAYESLDILLQGGAPTRMRTRTLTRLIQALDSYLYGLNHAPRDRPRKPGIHPSELSTTDCDRRVAYTVMGQEEKENVDPTLRRIFDVGHVFHHVLQTVLRQAYGGAFRDEVPIHNKGLQMVGNCDGVLGDVGFEFKSINDNGHKKLRKAKTEHEEQGVLYAANLNLTAVHYIYANKETGVLTSYEVSLNRDLWQKMAARSTRIIRSVESGVLPGRITSDYVCEKCKYSWVCRPGLRRR